MMRKGFFLRKASPLLLSLLPLLCISQNEIFRASELPNRRAPVHDSRISEYAVMTIDLNRLARFVRSSEFDNRLVLDLGSYGVHELELFERKVLSENAVLTVASEDGMNSERIVSQVRAFFGNGKGGKYAATLTVNDHFLASAISIPGDEVIIVMDRESPMRAPGQFLVYYKSKLVEENYTCGTAHTPVHEKDQVIGLDRSSVACRAVEYAYANDFAMFSAHGSSTQQVINHNIAVMNDVMSNYDNEFNDALEYTIVEVMVSTCGACDPWTNSTEPGEILNSFSDWGGTGFQQNHDVATLWTGRDLDGLTIGIAWLSAVCDNGLKYNVCEDFTNNPNLLRVLLAHELGHNYGASHDGTNASTIMAPRIQNTNSWSNNSINTINAYLITSSACLGACEAGGEDPPVNASFSSSTSLGCDGFQVQFFDESSGDPTSWSWQFPGGSPSSSIARNPVITYSEVGQFSVSLSVANASSSDDISQGNFVTVLGSPQAEFLTFVQNREVYFVNQSEHGDSYLWDFGDGNTSTQTEPTHTYAADGEYIIQLFVTNNCNTTVSTKLLNVSTLPVAQMSLSESEGCGPLVVQYTYQGQDNVDQFAWSFPGGQPSGSSARDPIVVYATAGSYSAQLTVTNQSGEDQVTEQDAVIVHSEVNSSFTFIIDEQSVSFSNTSNGYDQLRWLINGQQYSGENVQVDFGADGEYQVELIATGFCGADTIGETVSIATLPLAGFGAEVIDGCEPLSVVFLNASSENALSFEWQFPGGEPAFSTSENPTVVYETPGIYDVTLTVWSSIGSHTTSRSSFIEVAPLTTADFTYSTELQQVTFENMSAYALSYYWDFGNGATSTDMNPAHTFDPGEYTVTLIVWNDCNSDTAIAQVSIVIPPLAQFDVDASFGCSPAQFAFEDRSLNGIDSRFWSFPGGDPATSTDANPIVTYTAPGVYEVGLTVSNRAGSDSVVAIQYIMVEDKPLADFSIAKTGTMIETANRSSRADVNRWFFDGVETSSELAPIHDFGTFGWHEVMLIVENACGADTSTWISEFIAGPLAAFDSNNDFGCAPLEVQFTDLSMNSVQRWRWQFPGGSPASSIRQNPVVTYSTSGVYDVVLIVENLVGADTIRSTAVVNVNDIPDANFEFVQSGGFITFVNNTTNADEFYWDFGDSSVSTMENPSHEFINTGLFTVVLHATNACGQEYSSKVIQVKGDQYDLPVVDFSINVWPNPGNGNFNVVVPGDEQGELRLVDISGRLVQSYALTADQIYRIMLAGQLPSGLYYLTAQRGDNTATKALVVEGQ